MRLRFNSETQPYGLHYADKGGFQSTDIYRRSAPFPNLHSGSLVLPDINLGS